MKKRISVLVVQLMFLVSLSSITTFSQDQTDKDAIRRIIKDEIEAWNKGDAAAYSEHFAEEGTFTNILGAYYKGYDAFLKVHVQIFNTIFLKTTLQQDIVSLQFADSTVAVVEVLTAVSGMQKVPGRNDNFDSKGRLRTRLLQVVVKRNGKWEIIAYHNVEVKDALHLPEPK